MRDVMEKMKGFLNKISVHIIGYRSRDERNMLIASVYYFVSFIIAIAMGEMFLFSFVFMCSIPFAVFAIIDMTHDNNIRHLLRIPICIVVIIISAVISPNSNLPQEIQIVTSDIVFEDINQSQNIEYNVIPADADTTKIKFASDNLDIVSLDNNKITAISEGVASVYAFVEGTNIKSSSISVTVIDKEAEISRQAQNIIDKINSIQPVTLDSKQLIEECENLYNESDDVVKERVTNISDLSLAKSAYTQLEEEERIKQEEAEKKAKQEREAAEKAKHEAEKKAKQEAETKAQQKSSQNKTMQKSAVSESSSRTVYIGETGNKYHKEGCGTLKGNGRPISVEKAQAQGRTACKRCGG